MELAKKPKSWRQYIFKLIMNVPKPITLDILKGWASKNPYSAVTLKRAPPMLVSDTNTDFFTQTYKLIPTKSGKWSSEILEPAGIISYILWIRDPLYRVSNGLLRRQIYNESILELQQELESKITGTKFSRRRRKMIEVLNGSCKDAAEAELHDEFWATVLGYQFVKISTRTDAGHRIRFCPAAVNTWTADKPILFVDENFESVFIAPSEGHERKSLPDYILKTEDAGWKITWPMAEGTVDELNAAVIPLLNKISVPEKTKKAELATIIGKYYAMQHLINISGIVPQDETDI